MRWWGEVAVDGEGGFEGDEGTAVGDGKGPGIVELAGFGFEWADGDLDAGGAEAGDAPAGDQGVWVDGGDDGAGDAGVDEGVGAGWGSAVVSAGFEGDVGGGAGGREASSVGLFEGGDFGVVALGVEVRALPDNFGAGWGGTGEDAADLGVGAGEGGGGASEGEGSLDESEVEVGLGGQGAGGPWPNAV